MTTTAEMGSASGTDDSDTVGGTAASTPAAPFVAAALPSELPPPPSLNDPDPPDEPDPPEKPDPPEPADTSVSVSSADAGTVAGDPVGAVFRAVVLADTFTAAGFEAESAPNTVIEVNPTAPKTATHCAANFHEGA